MMRAWLRCVSVCVVVGLRACVVRGMCVPSLFFFLIVDCVCCVAWCGTCLIVAWCDYGTCPVSGARLIAHDGVARVDCETCPVMCARDCWTCPVIAACTTARAYMLVACGCLLLTGC